MMNLLAYADGENDLLAIAETIGADLRDCEAIAETLCSHGLLELVKSPR